MDRNRRKRKTLAYPPAPSPCRRRCEDHVGEWRNWASLPRDVLCIVLSRLPQTDILRGVELVCSPWRRLALHEPLLWRHIDLTDGPKWWFRPKCPPAGWKAMAYAAVDRSAGGCESFTGNVDADVLVHLANRAPSLRNLYVSKWPYDYNNHYEEVTTEIIIKKVPLLEHLGICSGLFTRELLVALLDHCPNLQLLDVTRCRPTFRDWAEPIATTIRTRSNIKHLPLHLLMPTIRLH